MNILVVGVTLAFMLLPLIGFAASVWLLLKFIRNDKQHTLAPFWWSVVGVLVFGYIIFQALSFLLVCSHGCDL